MHGSLHTKVQLCETVIFSIIFTELRFANYNVSMTLFKIVILTNGNVLLNVFVQQYRYIM